MVPFDCLAPASNLEMLQIKFVVDVWCFFEERVLLYAEF